MRPRFVVLRDPDIEIALQVVNGPVDFLAERHAIKLIEYGSMEAFADSVGLLRVSRDREHGFQRIVSNDFRGS